MMENGRHSLSSLPILSRLDHLDLIIKNIERQQNDPKWRNENALVRGRLDGPTSFQPSDTTIREAYFKGSLLERVTALENRLFQVCLELESSSTSSTSTGGSGGESSSQRRKKDFLRTLPTFNNVNPIQVPRQHPETPAIVNNNNKFEIQEVAEKEQGMKNEKKVQKTKQQNEKKQRGKDEYRTCKTNKKKSPSYKWTHFKLLGC